MMTILIFGAAVRPDGKPSVTLQRRVEAALACAKGHREVRFIPTGAIGRHGPSEASVMADLLMKSGVSGQQIQLEETGSDTLSSVRALVRLLRKEPSRGRPVMVATSGYHLPRCLILLRLFGMAAQPCRLPRVPASATWWLRWYWRLREVPALPYDATLALWLRLTGKL
jgi:uncharacterized SAM-binding protein YcdF (DUF218 family)